MHAFNFFPFVFQAFLAYTRVHATSRAACFDYAEGKKFNEEDYILPRFKETG